MMRCVFFHYFSFHSFSNLVVDLLSLSFHERNRPAPSGDVSNTDGSTHLRKSLVGARRSTRLFPAAIFPPPKKLLHQPAPSPRTLAPLDVHFIHKKANRDRPAAPPPLPLLLLHGWPASVVEFLAVIGPLTDPGPENPTAQAFDVVAPSLPGFGFSEAPAEAGWGLKAMASCFDNLMARALKYESYCVQGGDWGSMIARRMALDFGSVPAPPSVLYKVKRFFSAEKLGGGPTRKERQQQRLMTTATAASASSEAAASSSSEQQQQPETPGGSVIAIHQNMAIAAPRLSSPRTFLQLLNAPLAHIAPVFITKDEAKGLRGLLIYQTKESGYFKIQSTKPMTLGYGLSDSPVAALAWVSVRERKSFLSIFVLYFFLFLVISSFLFFFLQTRSFSLSLSPSLSLPLSLSLSISSNAPCSLKKRVANFPSSLFCFFVFNH